MKRIISFAVVALAVTLTAGQTPQINGFDFANIKAIAVVEAPCEIKLDKVKFDIENAEEIALITIALEDESIDGTHKSGAYQHNLYLRDNKNRRVMFAVYGGKFLGIRGDYTRWWKLSNKASILIDEKIQRCQKR